MARWVVILIGLAIAVALFAPRFGSPPESPPPPPPPPVISALPAHAPSPNARGVWFICDAVQRREIFVVTLPDPEGRFELIEYAKGSADVIARTAVSLNVTQQAAARTPFFANDAEAGAIITNGGFTGRNTPPIERLSIGDREFTCLWRNHTVLMGFTESSTFIVTAGESAISFGGGGSADAGILVWFIDHSNDEQSAEQTHVVDARNARFTSHLSGGIPRHSEGIIRFDFPLGSSSSARFVRIESNVSGTDAILNMIGDRELPAHPRIRPAPGPIIALQVGERLD